jgi:uncharacterized protein YecE (DUF72 family)
MSRRSARIRYGPAGWDYKDWSGIVYPGQAGSRFDPLQHLAGYFDTLEINSTFYGPPKPDVARRWAERVSRSARFRFTAKLWRRFTHERSQGWTREDVKLSREPLEILLAERRLGAVLLQFPWSFRNDEKNREWLRDVCAAMEGLPRVLEVRHASWNTPDLYGWLEEQGVGFVNIDQPLFKSSLRPSARVTAPVAYVRVHGRNFRDWFRKQAPRDDRYNYLYSAQELAPWAERIQTLADTPQTQEIYVVTNNHFRGKAPANALMLQAMVEGAPVPVPPELRAAYPEALGPWTLSPSADGSTAHPAG